MVIANQRDICLRQRRWQLGVRLCEWSDASDPLRTAAQPPRRTVACCVVRLQSPVRRKDLSQRLASLTRVEGYGMWPWLMVGDGDPAPRGGACERCACGVNTEYTPRKFGLRSTCLHRRSDVDVWTYTLARSTLLFSDASRNEL